MRYRMSGWLARDNRIVVAKSGTLGVSGTATMSFAKTSRCMLFLKTVSVKGKSWMSFNTSVRANGIKPLF